MLCLFRQPKMMADIFRVDNMKKRNSVSHKYNTMYQPHQNKLFITY